MTDTTSTQEKVSFSNQNTCWENWCQETARYLNKNRLAHAMFGWGDSFNLAISLPKLVFDEEHFHTNVSSAAELNAWLLSPLGLSISVSLCLFSILGNYIDSDQANRSSLAFFADLWPYVRDILKAYKWIAKAVCNLLLLEMSLCGNDVASLVIPCSLLFGTIAAIERVWYRSMKEKRMQMEKLNSDTAKKIYTAGLCFYEYDNETFSDNKKHYNTFVLVKDLNALENSNLFYYDINGQQFNYTNNVNMSDFCSAILGQKKHQSVLKNSIFHTKLLQIISDSLKAQKDMEQIKNLQCGTTYNYWKSQNISINTQSTMLRVECFFAKGLESLFNGMYFYSGAMIMTAFSPETFFIMSAISLGFLFSSFIAKLYEEYSYQKKLDLTSSRLNLALSERKIHALLEDLLYAQSANQADKVTEYKKNLKEIFSVYEQQLKNVQQGLSWTYTESFFEGLQNGLSLQSAITSLMFCLFLLNIVSVTSSTVFYFTLVGAASVLTHCIYSLYQCFIYKQESVEKLSDATNKTKESICNNSHDYVGLKNNVYSLQTQIKNSSDLLVSPRRFSIVEFEIFRVCFAGFKKGTKAGDEIDDLLSCFNDQSFDHWSYFGKISLTILFAVSFAARTLAKNCAPSSMNDAVNKVASSQDLSGSKSPKAKLSQSNSFFNGLPADRSASLEINIDYLQLTA